MEGNVHGNPLSREKSSTLNEALNHLKAHLAEGNLGLFFENSRTLAAVIDSLGVLVGWNPAFEKLRAACSSADSLPEYLSTSARLEFLGVLRDVLQSNSPARVQLELGPTSARARYDCLLIAQPTDVILFIGEGVSAQLDQASLQAAVAEQVKLRAELDETRQILEVKKTELQAVLAQADEVKHTDALTLLPNRRWIISDLQKQVNVSERYRLPLSVSMIDIDNFKLINDTRGHAAGDQVLRYIASEMRDHIRQPDQIGRYGGDEFLVILPNTNEQAAAEQAARLCEHVKGVPIIVGNEMVPMSISIGIAQYRPGDDDWRTLLERADQALYKAKANGRSQWASMRS